MSYYNFDSTYPTLLCTLLALLYSSRLFLHYFLYPTDNHTQLLFIVSSAIGTHTLTPHLLAAIATHIHTADVVEINPK